jgi:hypothetical protein
MTPTPASAGATGGAAVSEHLPAPGRYRRKRPTEVEAIQWTGRNFADVKAFGSGAVGIGPVEGGALPLWVVKSSATCRVERGDWIIRERDGSGFYPCNADVFAAIYEPAGGTGDQPDPALPVAAALEGDSERPGGAGPSVDTPQALPTPPDSARDDLGASPSSPGVALIRAERARQVAVEGYTPEHDAEHIDGELAIAAQAYLLSVTYGESQAADMWPFDPMSFRLDGQSDIDSLVKAGALIAAEIDRLTGRG